MTSETMVKHALAEDRMQERRPKAKDGDQVDLRLEGPQARVTLKVLLLPTA